MRHIILYHLSRKYVACRYIIVTLGREISPYDPERPNTLRNDRFVAYSGRLWEVHHDMMHAYFSLLRASRKEAFVETLAPPVALTYYQINLPLALSKRCTFGYTCSSYGEEFNA